MPTRAQRRRRLAVGLSALAAWSLAVSGCGGGASHASSSRRHVTVSGGSTAAGLSGHATESTGGCPGASYAPGNPYRLKISGTIRGSLVFAHDDYGARHPAVMPHIAARFCGTLNVATEAATVFSSQISFAPAHIYFDYHFNKKHKPVYSLQDKVKLQQVGTSTAQVDKTAAAPNGGLNVTLTSQVNTWVYPDEGDNAVRCLDGPVSLRLSTTAAGGSPLTGRLQDGTASIAQSGFTVPAAATGQKACRSGSIDDALIINGLLHLPADDTKTVETLHSSVSN